MKVEPEQGGMQVDPERGGLVNSSLTSICLETIALGLQGWAPAGPTSSETYRFSGYANPPQMDAVQLHGSVLTPGSDFHLGRFNVAREQ
jgi:hypothetical protein